MTKQHFIALADVLKEHTENANYRSDGELAQAAAEDTLQRLTLSLANFCQAQNPQFNRTRWLAYIKGECGPNGGSVKGK